MDEDRRVHSDESGDAEVLPVSTLLQDNFTDTNGTLLTSHTMDVGAGWTQDTTATGAFTIQSNQAFPDVGSAQGVVYAEAGATDYTATMDLIIGPGFTNDFRVNSGFVFRYVDADHYWLVRIEGSINSGQTLDLYENNSGFTLKAQQGITVNPWSDHTYTLTLIVSGTSATFTMGGVDDVTYGSMGTSLSATKVGLWGRDFDAVAKLSFDTFLVTAGAAPKRFVLIPGI